MNRNIKTAFKTASLTRMIALAAAVLAAGTSFAAAPAPSMQASTMQTSTMPSSTMPSSTTQACDVKSPRDAASGQATGKRQHRPVRSGEQCDDGTAMGSQAVRESPSKASLGKTRELTGHVTLIK